MPLLERLADAWIGRNPGDKSAVGAANAAVAHLKPAVLVTGGSRGIGLAIAERFAEKGRDVALVARGADELARAAQTITARTGRSAVPLALDLTAPGSATALQEQLATRGFYVDVLVNNAAIGLAGPFAEADTAALATLTNLNVTVPTVLTRHVLGPMLARRRGGILNIASLGGAVPGPHQAAYYASKAYVLSLTQALAAECRGNGVRVCVVAPGPVDTRFHADMAAEQALYRRLIPSLSPKRAAHAAYRGYTLGQLLVVPGFFNRLAYTALRVLPHPLSVPIVALLLQRPRP